MGWGRLEAEVSTWRLKQQFPHKRTSPERIFNVMSATNSRHGSWRRWGIVFALLLASAPLGCGSSESGTTRGVVGARKLVKEEDFTKVVGTGRKKRKEEVSRRDRVRILREAGEKLEGQ
jgi:hypothetical protein